MIRDPGRVQGAVTAAVAGAGAVRPGRGTGRVYHDPGFGQGAGGGYGSIGRNGRSPGRTGDRRDVLCPGAEHAVTAEAHDILGTFGKSLPCKKIENLCPLRLQKTFVPLKPVKTLVC